MDPVAERIIEESLKNGQQPKSALGAGPDNPEPVVAMRMPDGSIQAVPYQAAQVLMLQQISGQLQTLITQGEQMANKIAEVESRIPGFSLFGRKVAKPSDDQAGS